jgi:hypothetical protein
MNDRLKELIDEAAFHEDRYALHDEFALKLAELIIQECLDICEKGVATQTTSAGAAMMIKQHFGIK